MSRSVTLNNVNKNKGYTLIELLGVIVILAIIALIVIPTILNVVDESRKNAFKDSVLSASNAIEYYMYENKKNEFPTEGIDVTELNLKDNFISGKFKKNKNGEIEVYFIKDENYCANGKLTNLKIASIDECYKVDITESQIDLSKYYLLSTTSTITVRVEEGLGFDKESGIKEYRVRINGEEKIIKEKSGEVTFNNLIHDKEYKVEIIIVNGNDINKTIEDKIKTKIINVPTYTVEPTGDAQSKKVTIDYKDESNKYKHEYSVDGGLTFKEYTGEVIFEENGTIIAQVTDGTNYVLGSSQTVTDIDTSAPTNSTFTYTKTSKSITVTASGTDEESGIYGYQFSKDNGTTWTSIQTEKTYTFNNLKTDTYNIKVKVINNTYKNEGINKNNSKESISEAVPTTEIDKPIYAVDKTGWSQSKVVTITYPVGYTNEYSVDGGTSFKLYEKGIEFTSSGTIIAQVTDGTNYVSGTSQSVAQIDRTKPTKSSLTYEITTNSIKVTASGEDKESGIYGYQFSKDDGSTWTSIQTGKTYTFSNVKTGTYKLKVRTVNGTYNNEGINSLNYLDSSTYNATTAILCTPTYTITPSGWSLSKKVAIQIPNDCPTGTLEYSIDGGKTFKPYSSEVSFTADGTIIAQVTDGTNYVTGSSQTVTDIDASAPTSSTFSYTRTSKSITVVASGTDSQSGIYGYQFSKDDGATWTNVQTTNNYTYSNLTSGTYKVKVRVINNTYTNSGLNSKNYLNSSTQSISTVTIPNPTYSVSNSTTSNSKIVTITYPSGYNYEYSLDSGKTWKTVTSTTKKIEFQTNGTVIARVNDGKNYVTGSTETVNGIDNTPIGTILIYSGKTIPTGYLECNGQAVSRTTYSKLFAVIGTTYGSGDGSTTFNLPNLSGRVALGKGTGTDSNSTSKTFNQGSKGGEYTHALTVAELPSHTHTYTGSANTVGNNSSSIKATFNGSSVTVTDLQSKNYHTHNVVPPSSGDFVVNTSSMQGNGWACVAMGLSSWDFLYKDGFRITIGAAHWFAGVYGFTSAGSHSHNFTFNGSVSINYTHKHSIPSLKGSNTATGSGSKHNNIQPYLSVPYIIKY